MCKFFKPMNIAKAAAVIGLLIPFALMIDAFKNKDGDNGVLSMTWLATAAGMFWLGNMIGKNHQCPLPHVAENVQIEGQPNEEFEAAEPPNLLPQNR